MADLRDLGLSEYEACVYRALLETGPTTAKQLSDVSDVPMGRIYDVLSSIEQQGLVRSQAASRPKKFAAVEPETALDRLLDRRKEELHRKAEQYEETADTLAGELDTNRTVDERFWTAAVGPDDAFDLLIERLAAADERLVMVAATHTAKFDLDTVGERTAEALEAAVERGVDVSVLMTPDLVRQLPASVGEHYQAELAGEENFAVRTSENVRGTFNLVDEAEVCIEVPHPLDDARSFAMIDLKDRGFAADIEAEFEPRWADAEPLNLG